MRNWDIKLDQYGIGRYAYRELRYFCLQYEDKKRELKKLLIRRAAVCSPIENRDSCIKETEKRDKARIEALESDIKLLEQTAIEVSPDMYQALIKHVAEKIPYEHLGCVPMGRKQFYELRRKFFYELHRRKEYRK